MKDKKIINLKDESIIKDAVLYGKKAFIDMYIKKGFKEDYLMVRWHDLKITPYGRRLSQTGKFIYSASEKEIKKAYKNIKPEKTKKKKK